MVGEDIDGGRIAASCRYVVPGGEMEKVDGVEMCGFDALPAVLVGLGSGAAGGGTGGGG